MLADAVGPAVEDVIAAARAYRGSEVLMSNAVRVAPGTLLGVLLAEVLVHAGDIARAKGQRWPLDRSDALICADAVIRLLPEYVVAERPAGRSLSYALKLRGGPSYLLEIDDGIATVGRQQGRRAQCTISSDPATFLLVGFGRRGQLGAALRGRMVAYGSKPWLAAEFGKLVGALEDGPAGTLPVG